MTKREIIEELLARRHNSSHREAETIVNAIFDAMTNALAKGVSGMMKFFITAPFMTVGSRPALWRIQPIIPVVVDFPLVPATPMP
jgi:hypothetical protein